MEVCNASCEVGMQFWRAHWPEADGSPPRSQSSRRAGGGARGTVVWHACATCRTYGASNAHDAICATRHRARQLVTGSKLQNKTAVVSLAAQGPDRLRACLATSVLGCCMPALSRWRQCHRVNVPEDMLVCVADGSF